MKYVFNGTSIQNSRPSNMDSLLLKSGFIGTSNAMLAVVCDGVGSQTDGGYSSATAVKMLSHWFNNVNNKKNIGLAMRDAVLDINRHIASEAQKMNLETATTLSALVLIEDKYYITHIGDSRIYSYENGVLSLLTSDDLSESGKLTGYIGKKQDVFMQYSEGEALYKTFIICSDGFYNRLQVDVLVEEVKSWNKRPSDEQIYFLTQYVIERGEKDNISLALVKIES